MTKTGIAASREPTSSEEGSADIRDFMNKLMDSIDGSRDEAEEAIHRIMTKVSDPVERSIRVEQQHCLHVVRTMEMRLELLALKAALSERA
jgi:hypothetical protein